MKLLNPRAVAELHGCSLSSVQAAIARGALKARPVYGPGGKLASWAISEAQAKAWGPDPERQSRLTSRRAR